MVRMKVPISMYMIIHNQGTFLDIILDECMGVIDEVVIVDGCFGGAEQHLRVLDTNPEQSNEQVLKIIEEYSKKLNIKYHKGIWKDELTKRRFGFEACIHDIILNIDSDELFKLYPDKVEEFIVSGKYAATTEDRQPILRGYVSTHEAIKLKLFNRAAPHTIGHEYYQCVILDSPGNPAAEGKWAKDEVFTNGHIGWINHLVSIKPPEDMYTRNLMYHVINLNKFEEADAGENIIHPKSHFGTDLMKDMGCDLHKEAYCWNIGHDSIHFSGNNIGKEYNLVPTDTYPLAEDTNRAWERIPDKYDLGNIDHPIPIVCSVFKRTLQKISARDLQTHSSIIIEFEDKVDISDIFLHYRVLNGGVLSTTINDKFSTIITDNSITIHFEDIDIKGEIMKTFLQFNIISKDRLHTFINSVIFSEKKN